MKPKHSVDSRMPNVMESTRRRRAWDVQGRRFTRHGDSDGALRQGRDRQGWVRGKTQTHFGV